MPAKKRAEKQSKKAAKAAAKPAPVSATPSEDVEPGDMLRSQGIVVTYAQDSNKLTHRNVRDISVSNLTLTYHGTPLIEDAEFTLNYGNRYGFIGRNGCGKSTFMKAIAARCFPIPDGIDIFHLSEEIEASDMTAREAVMSVDVERMKLEKEAEALNELMTDTENTEDQDEVMERLTQVYERLDELDASTAETRASSILSGLGFSPERQQMKTREFSGGWRMRIALARALFIQPTLLLLDEPTNHLDMEAVVWLEDYLSRWNKILFMVSHSQDFMNSVCTHIINLTKKRLTTYGGNYDTFVQTKSELDEEQMKRYKWEQDQIKHMKDYVARFGHGTAKNAKQAQSKEKTLEKMVRGGLTEKVEQEKALDFNFSDPGQLSPPVLMCTDIAFGYPGCEILYSGVDFGVDLDSRVALVGPNGAGKSTLLKIMTGDLIPVVGSVRPHAHLRISKFTQHFIDVLDLSMTPLEYFLSIWTEMTREEGRRFLGRFGVSGSVQTQKMSQLSDGQKSRVVLAKMAKENPHILLLDEPTNHLDMESIDSLAKAINKFSGGMVLVSHDMRLISQVAKEIWVVDNRTVMKYQGEISDFKMQLRAQMQKSNIMSGSDAVNNMKAPVLVPLAPRSTTGNTVIPHTAPPAVAPKAPSANEEDEVMKARMELADLAIERQRARQAKEKEEKATKKKSEDNDGGGKVEADKTEAKEKADEEAKRRDEERELQKAKKKKEKEAIALRLKQEEEERERRRLEKIADMEAAMKLREEEDRAREERARLRAEKEAKKKAEEDAVKAAEAEAKAARKREREARRKEKEEEKRRQDLERKQKWMAEARQDVWTQEQQNAFESALLSAPMILAVAGNEQMQKEKEARWNYISRAVEGKNRNQCLSRYRLLAQMVLDKKQGEAVMTSASVSTNA